MVLGGGAVAKEKRTGSKGKKLSKAEREARKAQRLLDAKASFALSLDDATVASLRNLTSSGKIEAAEKAAHATAAPGLAIAEILRTIAIENGPSFRGSMAAHVGRRFAGRSAEAASVLATVLIPEALATQHYEYATVRHTRIITNSFDSFLDLPITGDVRIPRCYGSLSTSGDRDQGIHVYMYKPYSLRPYRNLDGTVYTD